MNKDEKLNLIERENKQTKPADGKNTPLPDVLTVREVRTRRGPAWSITTMFLLTGFIVLITLYLFFILNYINPINTSVKVGDIKISDKDYDHVYAYMNEANGSEELDTGWVNLFISDTVILSEKAKEWGLDADPNRVEELQDKYGGFAERVALREALEKHLEEEASPTEEEMKQFYENTKNIYYIKDSDIDYYAVQSKQPLPEQTDDIEENWKLQSGTFSLLAAYGVETPEPGIYPLEPAEDGQYRYIIIKESRIEYIPFEKVKKNIENILYTQYTQGEISFILQSGRFSYDILYFR